MLSLCCACPVAWLSVGCAASLGVVFRVCECLLLDGDGTTRDDAEDGEEDEQGKGRG